MPQLAIQLDEDTAAALDEAAAKDAVSPSDWAQQAVVIRLQPQRGDRLPQSFFDVLGTWEDDGEPDQILRRIREGTAESSREPLL